MTFLEIVTNTWRKCGLTGAGPVTTVAQTDMNGRIVGYVKDAYRYVQQQHEQWRFHWARTDGSHALIVGQQSYVPGDFGITDFRLLKRFQLKIEGQWKTIKFDTTQDVIDDYDNPETGEPTSVLILPTGDWVFDTLPDDTYLVRIEYYRSAHELTDNATVPLIPEEFQWIIIYKAVEYYSFYDEDVSLNTEASRDYLTLLHRLERRSLPEMTFGESEFA